MSLDWDRFRDILENNKDNVTHIIQHASFITEFLSQLLESLKELNTSEACFEKYPRAGSTLTLASLHPYIGYDPAIASILLSCLLEYSKLELDQTKKLEKNSKWCIRRIRHFIHASRQQHENNNILIGKISKLLKRKRQLQRADTITRLLDTCLGLANSREASVIITELVSMALHDPVIDTTHFDPPKRLISDTFIANLADGALRTLHLDWPDDLRIKLYCNYEQLYEIEILDFLEKYTQQQTTYVSLNDISKDLDCDPLVRIANQSLYLADMLIDKLSHFTIHHCDWRIVRLIQYLHHNLTTSLTESFNDYFNYIPTDLHDSQYNVFHMQVLDYIYTGSMDTIEQRRNSAWCLTLAAHRFVFNCVYLLMDWFTSSQLWSSHIDALVRFINWIIYPSLDQRESNSLSDLEGWLQIAKGQTAFLSLSWCRLLNGNVLVISCFIICIFCLSDTLSTDEKLSMIEKIMHEPETGYNNRGALYVLLDYLEDIQCYGECYPSALNVDIPKIKQTVHNIL